MTSLEVAVFDFVIRNLRELRERVSRQAGYRCGYCLTTEAVVGTPMELDHLLPESLGGLTEEQNLWLTLEVADMLPPLVSRIDPGCTGHLGPSAMS